MFYVSLFSYLFFVAVTMADVKKEYGEFRLNHDDSISNSLIIQRVYSSRSLFKGVFGFNWCSPLDYKLDVTSKALTLFDCELGKHLSFEKFSDTEFRNQELARVVSKTEFTYHYKSSNTSYVFSDNGRLIHWIPDLKPAIYVIYKNEKMAQLLVKKMVPQPIILSAQGLVLKMGTSTNYEYSQGILKNVSRSSKQIWRYEYDEFLNMTAWRGLTQNEIMKYDSDWDRIVYLKDKNDCRFHFQYQIKDSKKFILESEKCLNTKARETLFEVVNPRLLVKSQTDTLGKEFRSADSKRGTANVETF